MKRFEIRDFIRSGVEKLNQSYKFNSGRITEFNSARDNEYPYLWLESLSSENTVVQGSYAQFRNWAVRIHIAKKDSADSLPAQYESIVDQCDELAYELCKIYNHDLGTSKVVNIEGTTIEPFIHRHADDLTGVILSFTLVDFDSTDVC